MPIDEVMPKSEFFRQLMKRWKANQKGLAQRLGVANGTTKKLLNDELVSRGVIRDISGKIKEPILNLMIPPDVTSLPADPKFYERLQHGYYLDHNRESGGTSFWHAETLQLKLDPNSSDPWLLYDGRLKNQRHGRFSVRAYLLNRTQFVFMAAAANMKSSFVAGFTRWTTLDEQPDEKILCGTWSGIDQLASRLAVYRMFLSSVPLTVEQLFALTSGTPIECVREDDEQASKLKIPPAAKAKKKAPPKAPRPLPPQPPA